MITGADAQRAIDDAEKYLEDSRFEFTNQRPQIYDLRKHFEGKLLPEDHTAVGIFVDEVMKLLIAYQEDEYKAIEAYRKDQIKHPSLARRWDAVVKGIQDKIESVDEALKVLEGHERKLLDG